MKNFPIDWVIDQDLTDVKKFKTYTGYTINCPFCGNKKHKFDVNVAKNRARCNACGKGVNSLQLHALLCGIDTKTAYRDLWDRYKGLPSDKKVQLESAAINYKEEEVTPLWLRNVVYRAFLDQLSLSDDHRENLRRRGLSDKAIDAIGYKDAPEEEIDLHDVIWKLCSTNKEVEKYFRKHDVRISGLYDLKTAAPKAVARKSGILCPIIIKNPHRSDDYVDGNQWDEENLISGFQIRYDDAPGTKRYVYYTSLEQETGCGFTGYESIHFRLPDSFFDLETKLFERPVLKRVVLTEGCLKADVASYLSEDMPFIAVLGVSNQRLLESACKLLKRKYSTEEIILAFDQDYEDNKNVEGALLEAKKKIVSAGLDFSECHWHKEYKENGIKGIDDLLLFKKKERENNGKTKTE